MPQTTLTRKQSVAIAAAMTALSHPRRVIIFDRLAAAPKEGLTYEALLAATGRYTSTLTHHLRPMFAAGLVVTRRKGALCLPPPETIGARPRDRRSPPDRGLTRVAGKPEPEYLRRPRHLVASSSLRAYPAAAVRR